MTGPEATCVRDWCRENAQRWMPDAFGILERSGSDLMIQMDALSPDFLRTVLSQTIADEQVVEMHAEICAALGLDGKFTAKTDLSIRPSVVIAGLYAKDPLVAGNIDQQTEQKWERWGFMQDEDFGGWAPRYVVFTPQGNGKYRMSRVIKPTMNTANTPGSIMDRDEAISVAGNIMSNSLQNISFSHAKLFFSFKASTEPWSFKRRKGLAAILNTITRKTEEDAFAGSGWLIKTHPLFQETEWSYPPLGPQQPAWTGAVHVSCGSFVWHSVMDCSIRISEDPKQTYHPIVISVTTTW